MNYVLGFAITKDAKNILLIKKNRPIWQKDKYNGIGGKVDSSIQEDKLTAMVREFKEETNIKTQSSDWKWFCTFGREGENGYKVHAFVNYMEKIENFVSSDEGTLELIEVAEVLSSKLNTVENFESLLKIALTENK